MAATNKKKTIRASKGNRKPTKKAPRKRRTLIGGRARELPDTSIPLPEPTATFEL